MKPEAPERTPLAFRVRPQPAEGFDSWLDRIVRRHETSRRTLFRYLDVDPDLANYDLARGKLGLPARHHATFDGLVAGLGWAVDVDRDAVMDGFAAGPAHWILPLTLRRYGCACCWSGLIAEGRPLYIRKDWIWSASWWCHEHQLPLSVMPAWDWPRREGSLAAMLGRLEAAAREIVRAARPTARLIAYNRAVIEFLRKGDDGVTPQRYRRYVETIVANRFHFSSERIRLLALRHSSGAQPARRFERFVALSRSELAKEGRGFFRRPQPRVEGIDIEAAIDRPRRGRRWEPDLPMLLQTYLSIAQRAEARGEPLGRPAGPGDNYGFYRSMNSASAQKWTNDRGPGGLGWQNRPQKPVQRDLGSLP